MKMPLSWLKEYVDLDATPEDIAEKLTFSGTEVEGIETVGGDFEGVVVGEVLSIDPHPNADRLRLCRVSNGAEKLTVVCGADNFEVGDKAPFAGVGVTLPNGLTLKRARIRGEESHGMLCAEDELGISEDHTGIMILPRDTAVGTPLSELLGPPETVFELEITWNRPDCLSVIGMARELAAMYGKELKLPEVDIVESSDPVENHVTVTIEDPVACPRYTARVLSDLEIGPSPLWMQRRLALSGVRPISNIVDVTNYVMLECGHPLHAFDHAMLKDSAIVVRHARDGETMATLDGVDRPIRPDTLVIADRESPVAIAGVMGGAGSEISDSTSKVLLESASFDPPSIRRTGSALGLSTESSHRFERGVDVGGVEWASRRAASLMVSLGGGSLASGVVDAFPGQPEERRISISLARTRRLLGFDITMDEIVAALSAVMLPVVEQDETSCTVSAPTFRRDIVLEADLIEEVARIHGLDKVPDRPPTCSVVSDADESPFQAESAVRSSLVGLGLSEIVNYSFLSPRLVECVPVCTQGEWAVLPNPVSADQSVLRPSLIPQMVLTLGRNLSHQVDEAALFEIGTVFCKRDGGVAEKRTVCIGMMGPVGRTALTRSADIPDDEYFLSLKGAVEALFAACHVSVDGCESTQNAVLAPGYGACIKADGKIIAKLGLLREDSRAEWRMAGPVGVAEIDLDALSTGEPVRSMQPIASYPAVCRDVAMRVNDSVTHARIQSVIRASAPSELTAVRLFDIFRGEGIGEGQKSLAYSLEFRSAERSLTDEDANAYHESVKQALRMELDAEIRDK